ncbi:MAG TPA: hypothetical protein VG963_03130, partial [Polyangiaceae bacterium]|nr:hypothetical protein [Polyangiaceae bacterium]
PVVGVLALLLLGRTGPRARLWQALALIIVAAVAGGVLTLSVRWRSGLGPGSVHPHLSIAASLATLRRVCDDFEALGMDRPYFGASMLLPALLLAWRLLGELGTRWLDPSKARAESISVTGSLPADVWFAATGLATLAATLAAVVVSNVWSQRYVLPVYVLPLAFGVIVGVPLRSSLPRAWFRAFELGTLFVGVVIARRTDRQTLHSKASLQSSTRSCLDHYFAEQGLSAGYAGYWQARPQMLLGRTPVTLAQVHGRLQPHDWASNTYWRTRGYSPELGPPRFSFAIDAGLDEHWLEQRFGAPRARHSCFGQQIWVYDRPQDVEFRNYVRSDSALETGDRDHWWLVQGSELARVRGADERASETAEAVIVELPHVHANVIEVVSPTRKPLVIGYRRSGVELATQEVTFPSDTRRLLAIPAGIDATSLDALSVRGKSDAKFHIKRIALMWDQDAERTRL